MVSIVKLEFDGGKLREHLARMSMTYKDAADFLEMDKNTIGKVIRGGNVNIKVLLTICNKFDLPIVSFFRASRNDNQVVLPSMVAEPAPVYGNEELSGSKSLTSSTPIEEIIRYKNKEIEGLLKTIDAQREQLHRYEMQLHRYLAK